MATTGSWFELGTEGEAGRGSRWGRVDAGRPRADRRSASKAKGGGGLWAWETQHAGTCKAREIQRWKFPFSCYFI